VVKAPEACCTLEGAGGRCEGLAKRTLPPKTNNNAMPDLATGPGFSNRLLMI
jgi:hypothetical protein